MRIVSADKVDYLRFDQSEANRFPNPYDATDEQIESVPYVTEIWPMIGPLLHVADDLRIIVTFAELKQSFDEWEQGGDPLLDTNERYTSAHDWIRDCIDHGLHPCHVND